MELRFASESVLTSFCIRIAIGALGAASVTQPARQPVPGAAWSIVSPVAAASWITRAAPDGAGHLELLVLWRGTSGWFYAIGGSSEVSESTSDGRTRQTVVQGSVRLTLVYDSSTRVATIAGRRIRTAEHNVVLVDDVDATSGPRVSRLANVPRVMPGSAGQIGLVLRASAEIMRFLRCDAKATDTRKPPLDTLCLENLGVEK